MAAILTPLKRGPFRWLFAGQTISAVGNSIFTVGLVALLAQGHPRDLGYSLAAQSLGFGLAVLVGGVIADRFGRVQAMLIADSIRLIATLLLAINSISGGSSAVILLSAVVGIGEGLFSPAYLAIVPDLVEPDYLTNANSLNAAGTQIGSVLGPLVGGAILFISGVRIAFLVDALTFLLSIISLLVIYRLLPAPAEPDEQAELDEQAEPQDSAQAGWAKDILAGISAVLAKRWVAIIVFQGTLQLIFVIGPVFVLVPLTLRHLNAVHAYGFLVGAQAVGAVAGAVIAARWRPRRLGTVSIGALALVGLEILVMIGSSSVVLLGVSMVLTGAGYSIFAAYWSTALQRTYHSDQLGRVFSVEQFFTYGLSPLGVAITPLIVGGVGLATTQWIVLVALLLSSVIPLASRQVRYFADSG